MSLLFLISRLQSTSLVKPKHVFNVTRFKSELMNKSSLVIVMNLVRKKISKNRWHVLTLNEIGSYRKYADFESVERGEVGRQTQCVVVVRGMTMIILHAFYRLIFTSASKSIGGVAFTDVFIAFLANLVLRLIADFVVHRVAECPD